jgi:hypothetical protein
LDEEKVKKGSRKTNWVYGTFFFCSRKQVVVVIVAAISIASTSISTGAEDSLRTTQARSANRPVVSEPVLWSRCVIRRKRELRLAQSRKFLAIFAY